MTLVAAVGCFQVITVVFKDKVYENIKVPVLAIRANVHHILYMVMDNTHTWHSCTRGRVFKDKFNSKIAHEYSFKKSRGIIPVRWLYVNIFITSRYQMFLACNYSTNVLCQVNDVDHRCRCSVYDTFNSMQSHFVYLRQTVRRKGRTCILRLLFNSTHINNIPTFVTNMLDTCVTLWSINLTFRWH